MQIDNRLSILPNRNGRTKLAKLVEILSKERLDSSAKISSIEMDHLRIVGRFCETPHRRRLIQTAYKSSAPNSSSRCSNNRSVLSIGADVLMSTPASCNVSSGNFEPPDLRKVR